MATNKSSNVFQFEGFDLPTTTPVPDQLFDELLHRLTDPELRVLLYIIRRTLGFKKQSDDISLKQMVEGITTKDGRVLDHGTGASKPTVTKAIKGLVQKGIVVAVGHKSQEKGYEPTTYTLRFRGTPMLKNLTGGSKPALQGHVNGLNTQQTVVQQTVKQETDVVDVAQTLENFGIAKAAATKLKQNYPAQYIKEKVAMAQGLVAAGSSLVSQNPAGWLRKAIEEDYAPPRNPKRSRRRQARKVQDTVIAIHSTQTVATEKVERAQNVATQYRENNTENKVIEKTNRGNQEIWNKALEQVKNDLPLGETSDRLAGTTLIEVTETVARIGVANPCAIALLERRLYSQIAKAMKTVIGKDLDLQFIADS
jgi:Bacteriophage replication protein O